MAQHPMEAFDERWRLPRRGPSGAPLFLLAAGWRSGSTLLQRLACASGEVLVWGEPYGRSAILPALAGAAGALSAEWPTDGHYPPPEVFDDLSAHWIANLYPPPDVLREAYARFLDTLLAEPARARGFRRFGLKEVRLTADDARCLRWVYPDARFVFLVRNPWDAWASARGGRWWLRWPDCPVADARSFAEHWRRLTESFLDWPEEDGCLVRYEDLVHPQFDLERLRAHCRLESMDPAVRERVLRGIHKPPHVLPAGEAELIRSIVGEAAEVLGYAAAGVSGSLAPAAGAGLANP